MEDDALTTELYDKFWRESAPAAEDVRSGYAGDRSCLLCTAKGAEHHWAPRAIFPDWPDDLTVPLCEAHHTEWHDRMREHGLRWPHEMVSH